jgi:hypothetical protein
MIGKDGHMDSQTRKKKSRKQKTTAERLRANMAKMGLPEPKRFTLTPNSKRKMSEILTDFIAPYASKATTEERYRKLVSVAVVAWNASLFPPEERRLMLDSVIDKTMPSGAEDMKMVIQGLIQRKERYFSDIQRVILSYDLTMTKEGSQLSVASTR